MESRGSSDQEDEQIVQVREALMCPDGEKFEGLRTARFLNYTTTSIDDDVFDLPLDAFAYRYEAIEPEKWTENVSFSGWRPPSVNWIEWVNAMAESYATVWKESGVYDAIMASRYQIRKQDDLIMALVEKWCIETNTFVFPWGEATVTLEDMIVLGGFSVIGNNAIAPVKRVDMKEVEEKIKKAKREIEANSKKNKCCVSSWMKEMQNSGKEIEHEAFMVSWLSLFVFPSSADLLKEKLFPTAIQLAKGVKVALAPTVLARIYCDLGVLKEHIAGYSEKDMVVVKSPFHLVQIWALERIMELQPPDQPRQLKPGEPRIARWHHHDKYGYPENIREVLDSAKESFEYRPYTKPLNNFKFPKFYLEDDCWVRVRPDESIVAFGRCLRFSKLVGLDCIEPYYPHRVALQFGYDQDVPGMVPARTETPELAWKDYIRPIVDGMLYIPARLHEADVTVRYIRWWKLSVADLQTEARKILNKLLASPPKQKIMTTKSASSSPGRWKTSGAKDQEVVKKTEMETKKGVSVTGSRIEVNRGNGQSRGSSSYADSEQVTKKPLKMPEWVQRSSHGSTKSTDRSSSDDVKDLKGALRGSGGTKGHVTFQLPNSPSSTHTYSPKQTAYSPVKKPRIRVANMANQPSSSPRVPRHTSYVPPRRENNTKSYNSTSTRVSNKSSPSVSGSPLKKKNSPRSSEPYKSSPSVSGSPLEKKNSPRSSEPYKSSFLSASPSKKSLRSPKTVNSSGYNNYSSPRVSKEVNKSTTRKKSPRGGSSEIVNSSSGSITLAKQESPRKTQLKANVNSLEEIVTFRKQVDEGGEVTYQIPKQQFEDLSQGVYDVLHDLQSIKLALNIQDDDDKS